MTGNVYCLHGHPLTDATVYQGPTQPAKCFVCKVEARYRYWSRQGLEYTPGPTCAALIAAWEELGIPVRQHTDLEH